MSNSSAKRLASHGRGPDSTLVHMSPREVAGLDALARRHYGRGLSRNPKTGLPEAGVLDDLLPAIAGAGLTYFTGMSPGMAALAVGGGAAMASGSLEQGLLAGLGAYGGAGLGASMAGGATAGASSAATAPAAQFTTGQQAVTPDMSGMETASPGFDDVNPYDGMETVSPGFDPIDARMDQMGVMPIESVGTTGDFARMDRLAGIADPASVAAQGGGLGSLFTKGNMGNWAMAAAPLLGNRLLGGGDKGSPLDDPSDRAMIRPYRYDASVPGGMGYTALTPIRARDFQGFAGGGITGLLKGPGDGVSDSIPATVEGHEPAALGDGEYVMPARVVSALGNGSTSAGAARLDQMVQRVMRANGRANSKKNVAVDIKPDRLLAA